MAVAWLLQPRKAETVVLFHFCIIAILDYIIISIFFSFLLHFVLKRLSIDFNVLTGKSAHALVYGVFL